MSYQIVSINVSDVSSPREEKEIKDVPVGISWECVEFRLRLLFCAVLFALFAKVFDLTNW